MPYDVLQRCRVARVEFMCSVKLEDDARHAHAAYWLDTRAVETIERYAKHLEQGTKEPRIVATMLMLRAWDRLMQAGVGDVVVRDMLRSSLAEAHKG